MQIYTKGGLAIDQCAHRLMDARRNPNFIPGMKKEQYSAVYHEEGLYSVLDSKRGILSLVYAGNPTVAIEKVKGMEVPCGRP